jgi:hypothetical protein
VRTKILTNTKARSDPDRVDAAGADSDSGSCRQQLIMVWQSEGFSSTTVWQHFLTGFSQGCAVAADDNPALWQSIAMPRISVVKAFMSRAISVPTTVIDK